MTILIKPKKFYDEMYRNHDTGRWLHSPEIGENRLKNRLFGYQQSAIFSLDTTSLTQPGLSGCSET
jgi:hypothetical protein